MVWSVLIGVLGLTIVCGAILGAALGATGLLILYFFSNGATSLAVTAVLNILNNFTLSAIPLFILMGELLLESGVSARLYAALTPLFQRIPGGLLHTNIAVCTVFGAISGSSMSTAAAVGSVAYPEMVRLGYKRTEVFATLAAGGTLGLLIPPSLSLIIYGALTETSIGRLFLAGIIPGLILAVIFMLFIFLRARSSPPVVPMDLPKLTIHEIIMRLLKSWPVIVLVAAVMGSIVGGYATPTEAAGLGVVFSMIIGFIWGELSLAKLMQAFIKTTIAFATIGLVMIGAVILAQSISVLGLPRQLLETVVSVGLSKYQLLSVVVLIYLLLGCVFEGLSMMIMTLPIVFPLMTGLGFDPVWLGVLVTVMIEIAVITPPVGLNLYVLLAVTEQEVELGEGARASVPYWLILMFFVLLIAIFPRIVLFLPGFLN